MKKIIVPTDFSPNAEEALQYAINFANHFGSEIHLIHAFQVHSRTGMLLSIRDFMKKDAEEQLSALLKKYKDHIFHDSRLIAKAIEGPTVDLVSKYSQVQDANLIIMGTKGASGLKKVFMGSNASGVAQKASTPVLVIPEGSEYKPIKKIVFAVDIRPASTSEILKPLNKLVKAYDAHLEVFHLVQFEEALHSVNPQEDFFLKDVPHSFHQWTSMNDFSEEVRKFSDKANADLLVMLHRKRSFLDRILHSSATKKEVFETQIPLLILKDKIQKDS